jgi:23S rRNA (cytosine1962-C5)-methyltransferase
VLDRYGGTLVVKLYTASWLPQVPELTRRFRKKFQPGRLVLRLSRNIQDSARAQGLTDGSVLAGEALEGTVVFLENGLRFEADPLRGQKTGFFLDQRENRAQVGGLARGRRVLNTFSFSGGFSLYAARGGAASVTDVDISPHALAAAARNFALNADQAAVAHCPRQAVQADVFAWLKDCRATFDLVILDPPSLARREAERTGAVRAYHALAAEGLRHTERGGVVLACSCSAHVSADEFSDTVRDAAKRSGRKFQWEFRGHAPDHPATIPEAQYLKAVYLRLD